MIHPRYIACLLRLADLLDMDNNRYNIFNLNMLVELPEDSLNHIKKHFSIKNLRIDTERIDAYAECQNYEVYFLIQDWFNWIEEEVSNQMLNWNDIVLYTYYYRTYALIGFDFNMQVSIYVYRTRLYIQCNTIILLV